jgi:DNA-binding response OmpR family regulator
MIPGHRVEIPERKLNFDLTEHSERRCAVSTDLFYEFGPFRLDPVGRVLLREGRIVSLPPKVLDTLLVLVENHGRLVEKEKLIRSRLAGHLCR